MAEVVQKNLELMLPELEELERTGIFSAEEIKEVVRRRRNMEYKLQRRPARKEDYLRAIQYEVNLDLLRRTRKKRLGVTSSSKDAEFGIQNRTHSLFKRAVRKFKEDLRLWLQYIEFCRYSHHRITLGRVLGRALAIHPSSVGLWVMAAQFQFEELGDPSSARSIMQQGLRSNPAATQLWLEYFRLELMHVDKMRKRRRVLGLDSAEDEEIQKLSGDFFSYKTASIAYHQAVKAVPGDLPFRISFLEIYRLFEDSRERQEEVYGSIRKDFPEHYLCWDVLCRKHWVGVDTATLTESQLSSLETATEESYREGLLRVSEPGQLWHCFVQWSRERVNDPHLGEEGRIKAIHRLLTVFTEAAREGHLSEALVEQQVQTLCDLGLEEEVPKALEVATKLHPQSPSLWLQRIKCVGGREEEEKEEKEEQEDDDNEGKRREGERGKVKQEEEQEEEEEPVKSSSCSSRLSEIKELCEEALRSVPKEHSLPLWQYWLDQCTKSTLPYKEIERVFQSAIEGTSSTARDTLSIQYIDWAVGVGGVQHARRVCRKLLGKASVSYTVYCKCIELERTAEVPNVKSLRDMYEKGVAEYGSSYPDLWVDYIRFETRVMGADPTRGGQLHWRAMRSLKSHLTAAFISQHSLLQLRE